MKYRTVIFDVDGTLFDTSPGIFKCIEFVLKNMHYDSIDEKELRKFIGPPVYESFLNICKMTDKEAETATQMYRSAYVEQFIGLSKLYDGIEALLKKLKSEGVKLCIATMKTQPQIEKLLSIFNLTDTFDVVASASVNVKKSKSDIINEVLKATNTGCKDAVMIGDSIYDAVGAKQSGTDFVAVSYGFGISSEQQLKDAEMEYNYYAGNVEMLCEYLSCLS